MLRYFLLCCLASQSLGLVRHQIQDPKLNDPFSDDYIDKILENLRNVIIENNMDPMELPPLDTGFSDTILGITWHGSAHLNNGHFWGLSTLARTGDTSFTVEGEKARLTAYIGITGASAHYDASAEFMGITVGAGVTADISDIQIFLDAEMVLTGGSGLQLTDFKISHLGHISVDVSGLGPLDWILEILVDFVDTFLKDWIVSLVEGPLKDLIQGLLDEYVPDIPSRLL
eukprot:TRINITY_DN1489_c0_g1_i11.p1 TRINITY_DN1489_c0_g1~~TRINITY_DN1489_c0_g1_i11.p1  ORF type:complete len:229 (-),score=61.07 TRINITY_DN1489_c0_g1_i11:106-792(-)